MSEDRRRESSLPVSSRLHDPRWARPTRLTLGHSLSEEDVPDLHQQALGIALRVIVCDVSALEDPDVTTIDALARLQLELCRSGRRLVLCGARQDLRDLIALTGLENVLAP